jgi:hypothetical protein
MLPGVDIAAALGLRPALRFVGAFDGLDHVGPRSTAHLDFIDPQIGSSNIVWAQQVGRYIAVGSPQSHLLLVIDPASAMFTSVDVGLDTWWRAGTLTVVAGVRRNLSDVTGPAAAAFAEAKRLLATGASRQEVFNRVLAGGAPRDFAENLTSPPAQQFLHSAMTQADASRYFEQVLLLPRPRVIEMLEVRYLSQGRT